MQGVAGKACRQDLFCERWMCEQNDNRREVLRNNLPPGQDFMQALADCNAQQTDLLANSCTVNGKALQLGFRYDLTTCSQDKPPQLVAKDDLLVKAMSNAIEEAKRQKYIEADRIIRRQQNRCRRPNFKPDHPCVCDGTSKSECEERIAFDMFYDVNSPYFQRAGFDRFNAVMNDHLVSEIVRFGIATGEEAEDLAFQLCSERYGENTCLSGGQGQSPRPRPRDRKRKRARSLQRLIELMTMH